MHGYHFIVGKGAGIFAFDHGSGYGYQDGCFRATYYDLNGLKKKKQKIIDLFFTE